MKIVRLIQEFPKEISGGLAPNVWYISREQVKQGHKVWIFAFTKDLPSKEIREGVEIFRIKKPPLIRWFGGIVFLKAIKRAGIKPDIVHGLNTIPFGWLFPFAKRFMPAKYVMSIHTSVFPLQHKYHKDLKSKLQAFEFSKLCCFLTKKVDLILPVAKFIRDELIKVRIKTNKIKVISSGINFSLFSQARKTNSKTLTILYVGRIAQMKGLPYLIRACSILDKKLNVQLLLVGGQKADNGYAEVKKEISRYKLQNKVKLIPPVPQEKLLKYYRSADVFVLPSIHEPRSKALLEAMATMTPVIATGSGGNSEIIINYKNGLLVPPKDPDALACAIEKIIRNKNLKESLTKNGLETAKKHDWKIIAEQYTQAFEKIL